MSVSNSARSVLFALVLVLIAALAYLAFRATDSALTVWQKLEGMPEWVRIGFLAVLGLLGLLAMWLLWRIAHPGRKRVAQADTIDRARLEQRVAALPEDDIAAQRIRAELEDAETRKAANQLYVALFGDISAGKSALMQALSGVETKSDVIGGTTRVVRHAEVTLEDGLQLQLADVPGTNEVHGEEWSALAHGEAARAHALVYVSDGEPTRAQDEAIRRIGRFGKPLLIVLNKSDRYDDRDLDALLARMRERYADIAVQVLPVQAGGIERLKREDGTWLERPRAPKLAPLTGALRKIAKHGPAAFEAAREQSVLASADALLASREAELRSEQSDVIVRKYTKRAVLASLAAVVPGTDLVIQGALAIAMVRELATAHGLRVRDVDLDGLIENIGSIARTTTSVTLAIVGNALKAMFPGAGTVGGGLVHAVAYGLVFDSLGRAVAMTLAHARTLDRKATLDAFEEQLKRPSRERLKLLFDIAREAMAERDRTPDA